MYSLPEHTKSRALAQLLMGHRTKSVLPRTHKLLQPKTIQSWEPDKIIRKHDQRSYSVVTQYGSVYRRNRHLLKTGNFLPVLSHSIQSSLTLL